MKYEGFINILKPPRMTSHDVVMRVRRILKEKRIGHLGTLDPDAVGVLPIAVGQSTRLVEFLSGNNKTYRAQLIFGRVTDTQDSSGKTLSEMPVPSLSVNDLKNVMEKFQGSISQTPPMASAISVGGKRLYEYARQGIEIERPSRIVTIHSIEIVRYQNHAPHEVILDVKCSGGTYIRTLCHDIGQVLGCGGHMGWLIRTQSGSFKIKDSITLEALTDCINPENLVSMFDVLNHLPAFEIPEHRHSSLKQGLSQYLTGNNWSEGQWIRMHYRQRLLAVGQAVWQDERWMCQPRKVFNCTESLQK